MKCNEVINTMDDYLDQNIDKNTKNKIQEHLKICIKCKEKYKEYDSILQLLTSLPDSINPPNNNWKFIKKKINLKHKLSPIYFVKLSFAAFSLISIILFTSIYFNIKKSKDINKQPNILSEFNIATKEYNKAKKKLLNTINNKKQYLNEDTINSIKTNIAIIDNAINDITIALINDPSNNMLAMQLANTYQQQIKLILKTNQNILTIKN